MKHPSALTAAIVLGCALTSCVRDAPFAPGTYTVSGPVDLYGYFVDPDGRFAGTRVIGDANGVPVELAYGREVVARTTTVHGRYRFTGIRPGGYVTRARIVPGFGDESPTIVVGNRDLAVLDTLRLVSQGDLYPAPNPFADSIAVFFQIHDTTHVVLTLRDVAGHAVRTLLDAELHNFLYKHTWVMTDPLPAGAPPILYWLTLESDADVRAQLLVRERPAALPAP